MVGLKIDDIPHLFKFRPVVIGTPFRFNGANLNFFYTLHSIPCIGFTINFGGKSIYFSADTFYDPEGIRKIWEGGFMSEERMKSLMNNIWDHDLIFHEAGVPPIHTPLKVLSSLPSETKKKLYLVHVASKDIPIDSELKMAKTGLKHTLSLEVEAIPAPCSVLKTLDVLCSIELFEKTNLKNVRDLLECSLEKNYEKGEMVCFYKKVFLGLR